MKKSSIKPREYKYEDLKSVKANTVVDVYGVVKFLKQPFKTRGKDHCMVVSLVDPSFGIEEKLKCVVFNSDPEKLPKLKIGDIVRFHRLKIVMFEKDFQGQSGPGFSWVVFANEKDAPMDPLSTFSSNYTFSDADIKMIEDLRNWSAEKNEISDRNKAVSLENIVPQIYFDFVCQIVATCYFEAEHCFVLRVWDGTITIYQLRKFDFSEDQCPAYDQDLMKKAEGFLVDVALYDDHCDQARNKYKPGDFVKLVNLHAAIYKNLDAHNTDIPTLELVLHRGNSYGRGVMLTDDQTLKEYLSTSGNQVAKEINKSESTGKNVKSVKTIRHEEVVEDSQQPSTSNHNQSKYSYVGKQTKDIGVKRPNPCSDMSSNNDDNLNVVSSVSNEHSSHLGVKRLNPFSDIKHNNDINLNVVSSTSVEEQKSYGDNIQDYQLMEVAALVSKKSDINRSLEIASSGTRCMQQTVTVIVGHPHIKVTKIVDVLHAAVPQKFRILGNVEDFFPRVDHASDFLKLYCENCHYLCSLPAKGQQSDILSVQSRNNGIFYYFCPVCSKNKTKTTLQYIFMMRMKIRDETGSLLCLLWGKEATAFFRDVDAGDLLCSESLWYEIQEELEQMCSIDKPLFECCIKSYMIEDHTKYQIFDTSLV